MNEWTITDEYTLFFLYLKNPRTNPIIKPVTAFQNIIDGISASVKKRDVLHKIVSIYPRCHNPKNIEEYT